MKNAKTNGGGQLTAENIRRITEKNPFAKLGDVIYELIENAVLSSAMGPGERINLSKLSEQLGGQYHAGARRAGQALCKGHSRQENV